MNHGPNRKQTNCPFKCNDSSTSESDDSSTSESDSTGDEWSTTTQCESISEESIRIIAPIIAPKILPDDATVPPLPPISTSLSTTTTRAHYLFNLILI